MKYLLLLLSAVALVGLSPLAAGQASAQAPGAAPGVSPYLNLLRQGNSQALNYYGLVRPQVEFRSGIQQLQQQGNTQQAELAGVYKDVDPKGEVVLVIAGAEKSTVSESELMLRLGDEADIKRTPSYKVNSIEFRRGASVVSIAVNPLVSDSALMAAGQKALSRL